MPCSKWRRLPLTLETKKLVAQHPFEVDLGGVDRDVVFAAGDARPDRGTVVSKHFHRAEAGLRIAGRLEDEVGLAHPVARSAIDVCLVLT